MKILDFFLFLWVIFRIRIRNLNADPDPDPATQINADLCGSGSENLPWTMPKWQLWSKKDYFFKGTNVVFTSYFLPYLVSWTALALGHCPRYILRFPFGFHHILVFGTSAEIKITIIIFTSISYRIPVPYFTGTGSQPGPENFSQTKSRICWIRTQSGSKHKILKLKFGKMSGWKIFYQC
jgi:hypothetical protein